MRIAAVLLLFAPMLTASDETDIRGVLDQQTAAWNRGDVRGFMETYDRSPATTFVSDKITHGWDAVLARYQARYDTREKMGTLRFSELEVRMLGVDHAALVGRWSLERSAEAGGDAGGLFTLVLERRRGGAWKILIDHTH